jgi:hypothetical protein
MLLERIRNTGIALIGAAMSVAAWKGFAGNQVVASRDDTVRPVSTLLPGGRSELTIPVEIVEAGEAPRLHKVRVTR